MSFIKNHFHEELQNKNSNTDMIDADFRYDEYLANEAEYEKHLEERAAEAEFFKIYELTGTFPI